jgi:hypothetical protein
MYFPSLVCVLHPVSSSMIRERHNKFRLVHAVQAQVSETDLYRRKQGSAINISET